MISRLSDQGRRPLAARYGAALFACALAAGAQYLLAPLLGERVALAALPASVAVAAWFGGFGPALFATLAGSLTAYFFFQTTQRLPFDSANAVLLLLFALAGVLVSFAVRHLEQQALAERDARDRTEDQLRRTEGLRQLTATLSRAETPSDVMRAGLPDLLFAADAAAGAVFLTSEDGTRCELAHAVGFDTAMVEAAQQRPLPMTPRIAGAVRSRELARVASSRSPVAGAEPSADQFLDTHSMAIVVPLVAAGRAIGVTVLGFQLRRPIDSDEREFLLSAGRHTAYALDRARLYEATERARAEAETLRIETDRALLERRKAEDALRLSEARYRALAARTNRLYALNAGLSEAASIEAVARVVVREGKQVVGAAAGSVVLLADGGAAFETLHQDDCPSDTLERPRQFPADEGLCATAVVKSRLPLFVGSFAEWQDKYPHSASIAAGGGYASAAALPLQTDGAIFGVLSFHFTVPVNFDEEYRALLTSVAQHGAQALDRARLYESAERARAEAEAANRSKDDFLSTISHELRTPLNAMLGWAAMLRSGSIDAARTERAIEAIFNNATRQGRLIEELLDVSRIVAGRASVDLQETDLGDVIRGAVEAMMPLAAGKGVDLGCGVQGRLRVVADPRRLEQVLLNLLSNAVKFTPSGGRVAIDVTPSAQSVDVRVSDTGAGVDAAFLPHVFDRFRQADSTTTRGAGGLGLGLFIARQLMDAQNGAIRVESDGVGRGTAFTVTVPSARSAPSATAARSALPLDAAAQRDTAERPPPLNGIRVLLVDDEPDAREMMATALETCGATVVSASCAHDALEALAHADIDLLLSDIAMPGQDGYELIREIRAMSSVRLAALPAAAVTAHARDDERERALAAGFQLHLAKPVHPATLARAVASLALTVPQASRSDR